MRRARSQDLGVIFSPAHAAEPEIVEAIYAAAEVRGYHVILSAQTPTRPTGQAVEDLLGHRCAALIVIGSDLPDVALRTVAERSPVPVVAVGHGRRNGFYDVVRSSGDKGIAQAVDHLAELGHREIAYLHTPAMPSGLLRLQGYQRAMRRLGLPEDVVSRDESDYTEEAGSAAGRLLLEREAPPTAVVAANDQVAVGLLVVLIRNGLRVPQDISVTGFDDSRMARLSSVGLTTVRQDPDLMGGAAVQAAVRRAEGVDLDPAATLVETSLVVRGTTAAPRPA
jgi:DNA-binding LacI/PurR family transcriptional regulator